MVHLFERRLIEFLEKRFKLPQICSNYLEQTRNLGYFYEKMDQKEKYAIIKKELCKLQNADQPRLNSKGIDPDLLIFQIIAVSHRSITGSEDYSNLIEHIYQQLVDQKHQRNFIKTSLEIPLAKSVDPVSFAKNLCL